MDWTIRELGPEDAERFLPLQREMQALHARHAPHVFKETVPDDELLAFLRDRLSAEGIIFLGAVGPEGAPLGLAMVEVEEVSATAIKRARRRGVLHQIATAPEARRQGIGRALIAAVRERLSAEGVPRLAATYWFFNEASEALLRNSGLETAHTTVEGPV